MKLGQFMEMVLTKNEVTNLTAITDQSAFILNHFLDSIAVIPYLGECTLSDSTAADIGTGAGFPGLILAMFLPKWNFYLIERNAKKCDFVERTIDELGVSNAKVIRGDIDVLQDIEVQPSRIFLRAVEKSERIVAKIGKVLRGEFKMYLYRGPNRELDAKILREAKKANYAIMETEPVKLAFCNESTIRRFIILEKSNSE
ncbi:MAG: 16S rRNA (guanine(527)-N(7))-methyltransferase RsmG [Planctomycetes bacterium]|nr:16S rRNA (guanine(527)-N(7))-methyltransferase RsmG [Planctomycetota bacterium]